MTTQLRHTRLAIVISILYSVGQVSLGLILHPYQTMQMLVEDTVFVWLSLLPSMLFVISVLLWRFIFDPFLVAVFGSYTVGIIPFIGLWFSLYMLYWQCLLVYLLFRFTHIFRDYS